MEYIEVDYEYDEELGSDNEGEYAELYDGGLEDFFTQHGDSVLTTFDEIQEYVESRGIPSRRFTSSRLLEFIYNTEETSPYSPTDPPLTQDEMNIFKIIDHYFPGVSRQNFKKFWNEI